MQDPGEGDRDDGSDRQGHHTPLSPEQEAGLGPAWFPGLLFTYRVEHPPTRAEAVLDFVVLDGPGTDWTLDPVDDQEAGQEALAWALYWGLPVGAVDFQEYEPRREGEPMDWFSFPIEASESWQGTAPDGGDVTFRAKEVQIMLPEGETVEGYRVTGDRDDVTVLEYTYTGTVGWFVSLRWDETGDGEPELLLNLEDMGVDPVLAERPLRALERFVDLRVEKGELEDLTGGTGWPLVKEAFDVPSPGNTTFWLARYKGDGAYQANVSFHGEKGWETSRLPQSEGPAEDHAWGRLTPHAAQGEVRAALLGEGSVDLLGLQLAPLE